MNEVERLIKFLGTHGGRDKIAKTLHYSARIIIWWLKTKKQGKWAEQVEKYRQAVGSARRVGRFLSSINSVPGIVAAFGPNRERNPVMWALLLVADLADFLYFISDNITWFAQFGFIKLSPKAESFWDDIIGSWTWFVSVVICLIYDTRAYIRLQAKKRALLQPSRTPSTGMLGPAKPSQPSTVAEYKSELKEISDSLHGLHINFVRNLADLQLAIYFCFPNTWPSQWVGVFGVINAIGGIYATYPR